MYNRVIPRVSFFNYQYYDSTISWEKYNTHEHIRAAAGDFRNYQISIDDIVYIYDNNNEDIFAGVDPPRIDYITGDKLRISLTPTVNLNNTAVYCKYPKGDIDSVILYGVKVTNGSQIITINTPPQSEDYQLQEGAGLPGFISQKQLAFLSDFTLSFQVSSSMTTSDVLVCLTESEYPCRLNKVTTYGAAVAYQAKVYNPAAGLNFNDVSTWLDYGSSVSAGSPSSTFNYAVKSEGSLLATYPANRGDTYIEEGGALALDFSSLSASNTAVILHLTKLCQ